MALLNSLLGNGSRDRELAEDMRGLLQEMRQERERFEALIEGSRSATDHLEQLAGPIARAGADVDTVAGRLSEIEQRIDAFAPVAAQLESLDARSRTLAETQGGYESTMATVLEDSKRVRALFEELSQKVDLAGTLKERLEGFLEIEKPFQVLRDDADQLRGQVEGTGEHLVRLREQHERLMDAHKLATSKMEALDRRRDELSRDLQDKERRVVGVDQAVRGMDGVRQMVDEVKRELGTLKVVGDSLSQKTSALEAQREAADRALAQADSLERAMQKIDAGMRQLHENERGLGAMQDAVASLKALHEEVVERSSEITGLQRQTEEQAGIIRHELKAAQSEMKNAVERFDFESKGLESVSQRVADLRGALSDFENRYKGLRESAQTVGELSTQTHSLTGQVRGLMDETVRIDEEARKLQGIRRDLDEAGRSTRELGAHVARLEEARPAVEGALRDLEQLGGAHALVKDTLEQARNAHGEIVRLRESQDDAKAWLANVERSLAELRGQVGALQSMTPSLDLVQKQTERIRESMSTIESRGASLDELRRRLTELSTLGAELDDRGRQLQARMGAAEERFIGLAAHAEEAERLGKTIAVVSSTVQDAGRQTDVLGKAVAAFEARCTSVEGLAARTQTLRDELDQRQQSLEEASKNLQKASKLRQEAVTSAQKLDDLAKKLGEALATADGRMTGLDELSGQLEDRVANLRHVDRRLGEFEERLAKWENVDEEVARSLVQITARQGTVQSLQADLDRMFAMAEKTTADVRAITSAHREIAESRDLLAEVLERMRELETTTGTIDERQRQMTRAEERLARAEGFLADVRSSLEALQGQKAIVDQAVEKAGSLRFLVKQAEAMLEGLREERKMTTDLRDALSVVSEEDDEERNGHPESRVAH